jgi:hypothetical protein
MGISNREKRIPAPWGSRPGFEDELLAAVTEFPGEF